MPNESAHINLAVHNQKVINYLLQDVNEYSDWITTIAFYKALHIVEAILYRQKKRHGQTHENRRSILKENKSYHHIYIHYRDLENASLIARYLEDPESPPPIYSAFTEYLSPDQVQSEMLNHRLHQIEVSAKKFLSKSSIKSLKSTYVNSSFHPISSR